MPMNVLININAENGIVCLFIMFWFKSYANFLILIKSNMAANTADNITAMDQFF